MERTDWQSDKALEREAITHKTQHRTANTVYELHHTDSYKNHTHQEKLDERQFSGVLSTSADKRERKIGNKQQAAAAPNLLSAFATNRKGKTYG